MSSEHLILFDDNCPFCQRAIEKVIRWDKKKIFTFASFKGSLAQKYLPKKFKTLDSLILIEKFHSPKQRIWLEGRAVLRIFWLIGGFKKLIGWMAYFPLGFDTIYRFVARHRHRLGKDKS